MAASASTWSGRDTSVGATTTSAPAASTSAAASSSAPNSTSAITTRIPSAAARPATARPIPLPAPVSTATRPSKRSMPCSPPLPGVRAAVEVAVAHRLALPVEGSERGVHPFRRPAVVGLEVPVDAWAGDDVDQAAEHDEHLTRDLNCRRRGEVGDERRHVLGRELVEVTFDVVTDARHALGHASAGAG